MSNPPFRGAVASFVLFLGLANSPAQAAEPVCAEPRCIDIEVPVPDGLKVPDNRVRVILPVGYDADRAEAYPVLYMLNGAGGDYRWDLALADLLELTRPLELILVSPDAGGDTTSGPGWYTDWFDDSREWETYHIEVVIPYIDQMFNTGGATTRAVAGLSMGGYGAVKYAARHPGLFRVAASFSGTVDIRYAETGFAVATVAVGGDKIWGNGVTERENWRAHNPTDLAANLRGTEILLATGDGTVTGSHWDTGCLNPLAFVWCHPAENYIWQQNLSFMRALDEADVHYRALIYGGGHYWAYGRDALAWALPHVLATIG